MLKILLFIVEILNKADHLVHQILNVDGSVLFAEGFLEFCFVLV